MILKEKALHFLKNRIMTTVTHPELVIIPFSKLLKVELSRFATRVIGIVERHNPEELLIKKLFDDLVAQTPNIKNLKDKHGPHPLTAELRNLRKLRALYVSAIKFRLKVVTREDISGVNIDVVTVKYEIDHFLNSLKLSKNEEMFNQKVTQFFAAIENDEALSNALVSLEFGASLDKLKAVHDDMQKLITARLVSITQRPKGTTAQLTKAILTAIRNMIKLIEIAPLLNPTLDYKPLHNELNQLFIEYGNMIGRRASNNKRKAESTDNEQKEPIEEPIVIESIESEETMLLVNSQEKESAIEFASQGLSVVNEVAMLSRSKLLPFVYDDGD